MLIDNNHDLRKFAKILAQKMNAIGENVLAHELEMWDQDFFTTSSEFLGELKPLLERINNLRSLDQITKKEVESCLKAINKAFTM